MQDCWSGPSPTAGALVEINGKFDNKFVNLSIFCLKIYRCSMFLRSLAEFLQCFERKKRK